MRQTRHRFPGPGLTHDPKGLSLPDLERNTTYDAGVPQLCRERYLKVLDKRTACSIPIMTASRSWDQARRAVRHQKNSG